MTKFFLSIVTLCAVGVLTVSAQTGTLREQADAAYERGREMIHSKQFLEASALWDSIAGLDLTPDYKAKFFAVNGVLQRDSIHDNAKAREYFCKADALYPEVMAMRGGTRDVSIIFASMGLAQYADSLKQYSEAIEHYHKAIGFVNQLQMEGTDVINNDANDINLMLNSFKQGCAIAYGHNKQFEDAESAFEELKFSYGQMELSQDSDIVLQGWMFGCMARQAFALMYDKDMKNYPKALAETNALLNKLMDGLNSGDSSIQELLSYQMPFFLLSAADINVKVKDAKTAVNLCDNALTWPTADTWRPFIINTKGVALLLDGQEDEARKCWLEVKTAFPGFYDDDIPDNPLRDKFGRK